MAAPAVIYLLAAGSEPSLIRGWAIPAATDIAFAMGVLGLLGQRVAPTLRLFLLTVAIVDDIGAVMIIALFYSTGLDMAWLVAALVILAAMIALNRARVTHLWPFVLLAIALWFCVLHSGVHATIAGVMLGLVMAPRASERTRHTLEPWVNGLVLPLFAFVAAFVVIPQVPLTALSPAFFGILIALPVGKLLGISLFGLVAQRIRPRGTPPTIRFPDLLAAGALGGIGFTVSLLLANLAFATQAEVRDEAVLAVLLGSIVSLVLGAALVSWRAKVHRAAGASDEEFGDDDDLWVAHTDAVRTQADREERFDERHDGPGTH
jgi:NhaA family Na+:H+ antiporter